MKLILAWTANEDERDYQPEPRIKREAETAYSPHKGQRMKR